MRGDEERSIMYFSMAFQWEIIERMERENTPKENGNFPELIKKAPKLRIIHFKKFILGT